MVARNQSVSRKVLGQRTGRLLVWFSTGKKATHGIQWDKEYFMWFLHQLSLQRPVVNRGLVLFKPGGKILPCNWEGIWT